MGSVRITRPSWEHLFPTRTLGPSESVGLAWGLALFAYFIGVKTYLLLWYWSGGIQPIPYDARLRVPLLAWQDAAFSIALALAFAATHAVARRAWRPLALIVTAVVATLHLGIVVLESISARIQQLYGQPLQLRMLNWLRDLGSLKDSILASVDVPFAVMILAGALCFPIALLMIAPRLQRSRLTPRHVAAGLALACAFIIAGGLQFRSTDTTRGLKQNAILFFVRNRDPEPKADDYRKALRVARATGSLNGRLDPDLASVVHPGEREPGAFAGESAQGMNLLVILLESMPARVLSDTATPNLMALRRRSLVLARHYSTAPNTFDAHYSIFYSQLIRGTATPYRELYHGLPLDVSLFESASDAGMQTALFRSGYLDFWDTRWLYEGRVGTLHGAEDLLAGLRPGWSWGAPEELTVSTTLSWLATQRNRRFLAVYNAATPHHPYFSPDRTFRGSGLAAGYQNSLHYVDAQVGRLLDGLHRLGLDENTVVLAVADHGEEVGVGHGFRLDLDEMQVPAMIAFPHGQSRIVHTSTSHLDLAPTLASVLGFRQDPNWLGRDLTKSIVDRRLAFFGSVFGERVLVLDGDVGVVSEPGRGGERVVAVGPEDFEYAPPEALSDTNRTRLDRLVTTYDRRIRLRHFQKALAAPGHRVASSY